MKEYISVLKTTRMFEGVSESEIASMLSCLDAKLKKYKKGDYIYRQGDSVHHIIVLVKGCLHIQLDDYWGNRSIVNVISEGEMFGEAYAAPESGTVLSDVVAASDSSVIYFDVSLNLVIRTCFFRSVFRHYFGKILANTTVLASFLPHIDKKTVRKKFFEPEIS